MNSPVGNVVLNFFQFQTGAIKRAHRYLICQFSINFQFQTGAIKRSSTVLTDENPTIFNSKLVRLKEVKRTADRRIETVFSIPNWCD